MLSGVEKTAQCPLTLLTNLNLSLAEGEYVPRRSRDSKVTYRAPGTRRLNDILGVEIGGPYGRRYGEPGHAADDYNKFKDLIQRMLDYNPMRRISAQEAVRHVFLHKGEDAFGQMIRSQQHQQRYGGLAVDASGGLSSVTGGTGTAAALTASQSVLDESGMAGMGGLANFSATASLSAVGAAGGNAQLHSSRLAAYGAPQITGQQQQQQVVGPDSAANAEELASIQRRAEVDDVPNYQVEQQQLPNNHLQPIAYFK